MPESLRASLKAFASSRAWVIGDVMLDEYITGDVHRISPDAPVQVVSVAGTHVRLGGAANVAHGLAAFGCTVELIGVVGDDEAGRAVLKVCDEAGVRHSGVVLDPSRPTTRKLRVMAQRQHVLRLDWEKVTLVDAVLLNPVIQRLTQELPPDVIVLSDYAKGTLSPELIAAVIDWARSYGVPVLVDPKHDDFRVYSGATVITPNAKELDAAVRRVEVQHHGDALARVEHGARALAVAANCAALVVTLGENGMLVVPREGAVAHIHSTAREVYDVTGAGDTVIALLALGLAAKLPLQRSAELATVAAGLAVEKVGTAVVHPHELAAGFAPSLEGKVVTRDELAERMAWWRLQKKQVVLTNGCFDVLHAGHVTLLREAKKQGDILVVALNSDASVARLKGKHRPLVRESERAILLAALESVDAVVVFDEDTPLTLVRAVTPDVLVKGGDYMPENVVGRAEVEARGGKLVLVPLVEGMSTTSIVERMKES
ncbi:MAG: D-glycero-beta-D-manno-heptose-7-phosphate kinase [Clostridia bacterium]|nr:D-glycero-beta-D-manno-heptose-7-phosphate kinase [Deltaproteobacteria bacterium]